MGRRALGRPRLVRRAARRRPDALSRTADDDRAARALPARRASVGLARDLAADRLRHRLRVSRRHCQLSTDGLRWWVEDLQSANGTYLATAGSGLPQTPIPAGQRREVDEGDRLYVGAWTRLVLRRALPGEV
ncbi:FHA domain-containing protein [Rathayibacter oskolensis]|uniref:FHA domain-containing protein n=1 Tax=Rathayibacter oskolensis TaxID=1891671 RepID=UPI0034657D1D